MTTNNCKLCGYPLRGPQCQASHGDGCDMKPGDIMYVQVKPGHRPPDEVSNLQRDHIPAHAYQQRVYPLSREELMAEFPAAPEQRDRVPTHHVRYDPFIRQSIYSDGSRIGDDEAMLQGRGRVDLWPLREPEPIPHDKPTRLALKLTLIILLMTAAMAAVVWIVLARGTGYPTTTEKLP